MYVIPLVAVILLIVAISSRIPDATKRAAIVLAAVVVQVLLGVFGHGITFLALLHGLNALALFAAAFLAFRLASRPRADIRQAEPVGARL